MYRYIRKIWLIRANQQPFNLTQINFNSKASISIFKREKTKEKSSSNFSLMELLLILPKIKRFTFLSFKLPRLDFTSSSSVATLYKVYNS